MLLKLVWQSLWHIPRVTESSYSDNLCLESNNKDNNYHCNYQYHLINYALNLWTQDLWRMG